MLESPKEFYSLVEEKLGPRVADVTLWAVVIVIIAGGALALWTLGAKVYDQIAAPLVQWLGWASITSFRYQEMIASVLVTVTLIGGVGYFLTRRVRAWAAQVIGDMATFVNDQNQRIQSLEHNAAEGRVHQALFELDGRIASLEKLPQRLTALERRTSSNEVALVEHVVGVPLPGIGGIGPSKRVLRNMFGHTRKNREGPTNK